jgi:hypothetical protein
MPGTGSYIEPLLTSDYRETIDELLTQLPDNTANIIVAKDIRDSVWTLWNRIDDVEINILQTASFSATFVNEAPVPVTVGGITANTTFPTPKSMQEMWDMLLYPYIAPSPSFTALVAREFGATTAVTLNWSVVKNTNNIQSIVVNGQSITANGGNQSGNTSAVGSHPTNPSGTSHTNTFSMTVNDGSNNVNTSVNLSWRNRRFWGSIDLSSIGSPNLTTNPEMAGQVGDFVSFVDPSTNRHQRIIGLTGAGANGQNFGSELSLVRSKEYVGMNGAGNHLIFAFPTIFGTPNFTVNGLPNTAFTKVKSNFAFINQNSFSGVNFDIWVSNTAQNGSLNIVIS